MLGQLFNPAVVWVLIPIVAIITSMAVKWKKMELEHEKERFANQDIEALRSEILMIRRRMDKIEAYLATDDNNTEAPLPNPEDQDSQTPRMRNMLRSS
jgi:hypothetical protein